ncbi:hypothetical protein CMUS01_11008 [Colletotrichum musicola]|uniref:Uncharacterized protein n=1 Tax=Colletotrichum musicola TaxID=2175873 RepID=A0A8H6N7L2_9PEZI|nr:hypothetical protein CMUS01_11008 [Colletotrichum musicola]
MACIAVYLLFLPLLLYPNSLSPGTSLLARGILQSSSEMVIPHPAIHVRGESHGCSSKKS